MSKYKHSVVIKNTEAVTATKLPCIQDIITRRRN